MIQCGYLVISWTYWEGNINYRYIHKIINNGTVVNVHISSVLKTLPCFKSNLYLKFFLIEKCFFSEIFCSNVSSGGCVWFLRQGCQVCFKFKFMRQKIKYQFFYDQFTNNRIDFERDNYFFHQLPSFPTTSISITKLVGEYRID